MACSSKGPEAGDSITEPAIFLGEGCHYGSVAAPFGMNMGQELLWAVPRVPVGVWEEGAGCSSRYSQRPMVAVTAKDQCGPSEGSGEAAQSFRRKDDVIWKAPASKQVRAAGNVNRAAADRHE